jgi:hypothetical protein
MRLIFYVIVYGAWYTNSGTADGREAGFVELSMAEMIKNRHDGALAPSM